MTAKVNLRISIVMATWNGEAYLAQQLDSLLTQTHSADELLILDDGSRDGTITLLQDYARRHRCIRLVLNEQNIGVNANFRQGLRMSQGDLVFISDQDDIWAANKIERMLASWQGEDLVYSNAGIIDGQGKSLFASEAGYFNFKPVHGKRPAYFLFNNCISGHNIMVTRALIDLAMQDEVPDLLMYDQWLALLASLGNGVGFLPDILCQHRIHNSNANNNRALPKRKSSTGYEQFQRRSERFSQFLDILTTCGADLTPIHGLAGALSSHFATINQRWFNTALFLMLMRVRHDIYQSAKIGKNLRQSIKIATGAKAWRLSKI